MSNDASDPAKSSLVFAIITVVPAWVFIAAAFYEKLELLTWLQLCDTAKYGSPRDSIPSPWGSRSAFVFGEIGGFIWL